MLKKGQPPQAPVRTLYTDDHWISFPPPILKAVIVGCMMVDADRERVRSMVAAAGRPLALKHAVRIPNQYKLRIELLS